MKIHFFMNCFDNMSQFRILNSQVHWIKNSPLLPNSISQSCLNKIVECFTQCNCKIKLGKIVECFTQCNCKIKLGKNREFKFTGTIQFHSPLWMKAESVLPNVIVKLNWVKTESLNSRVLWVKNSPLLPNSISNE